MIHNPILLRLKLNALTQINVKGMERKSTLYLSALFTVTTALSILLPSKTQSQCTNPSIALPDTSVPVTGNPAQAYCVTLTFDPAETGYPTGMSMLMEHSWQGDLTIFLSACGNILNVMQRPGVIGSCAGGCECGNSNDIGTPSGLVPLTFCDGCGPDPENGISIGGGTFGVTADDNCGIGTVGSFAALWAACPPGLISTEVCVSDHAGADDGFVQNLTLLFPNPSACGCTDPAAINYNPNATVDDGSCQYCLLTVTPNDPFISACAGNSANIGVSVMNAISTPSYNWFSPDGGTGFLSSTTVANPNVNIPPGISGTFTYEVTVSSGPCVEFASITISIDPPPFVEIMGDPEFCGGDNTQLFATPGYSDYNWSSGQSNSSIIVNQPDTYFLTVTDGNGCSNTTSYTVTQLPNPEPEITGPATICPGGNGTLDAGSGYDSYIWTNGAISQTIDVFVPGFYFVTVTQNGCEGVGFFEVSVGGGPTVSIFGDNNLCENQEGFLEADPGFANYQWSTNEDTPSISINGPGTYSVTVSDVVGCMAEASFTVSQSPSLTPAISGDFTLCTGNSASLTVNGAFASLVWSTYETSATISPTSAGTYSVTVTDASGCTGTASASVSALPDPLPDISGNLAFCPGDSVQLTASGGFSSYTWSGDIHSQSIKVDTAGTYTVSVVDANGCQGQNSVALIENPSPEPSITGDSQICNGDTTTLSAVESFSSYLWSNNSTSSSISVDSAGTYSLVVTNAQGCEGSASYLVSQTPNPVPIITGPTAICEGASTVLDAGVGYSNYQWSPAGSAQSITANAAAAYTVTVTDANGCTGSASVNVAVNPNPNPDILGDNAFCAGDSASLQASPGYASYMWSNSDASADIVISNEGTYVVTVTDGNGCLGTASFEVTQLANPIPVISGPTQFCEGSTATLNADTGYDTYLWSDNSDGSSLQVSSTGTYSLTVTNASGCSGETAVSVIENPLPAVSITGPEAYCAGQSAVLSASAGLVSYTWNNSSTGVSINVFEPGIYSVIATDSNACQNTASFQIAENPLPNVVITGDLAFCEGDQTILDAGAGFANYAWTGGADNQTLTVNTPATYGVTVTDANGCIGETAISLSQLPTPEPDISGILDICPEGETILDVGNGFSSYQWSDGTSSQTLNVDAAGIYSVTVSNQEGCVASTSAIVHEFASPLLPTGLNVAFCANASAELSIGTGFASYLWETGDTSATIFVTSTGDFVVTVTDENGCIGIGHVVATQNELPVFSFSGATDFCTGSSTSLTINESFAGYLWNTNASTASITVGLPGDYAVTVTDNNGCQNSQTVTVVENPLPEIAILGNPVFCLDGSTMLSASGSYESYSWSNSSNEASIEVDVPGIYTLTVADSDGCVNSASVETVQVSELSPEIIGTPEYCAGSTTTLEVNGAFATYTWSNDLNTQIISVSEPGTYSVTVSDDNGCEGIASMQVIENPLPVVAFDGLLAFCAGSSTTLTATTGFISYEWSNGADAETVTFDQGGAYSLMVTDANGCQEQFAFQLEEQALPMPLIAGALSYCPGTSTTLTVAGNFAAYEWSNAATNSQIEVDQIGAYSVLVTDANGCQGSAAVDVAEFVTNDPAISGQLTFCPGTGTQLTAEAGFENYEWSTTQTQSSIDVTTTGTYSLTVTDANGCETSASATVAEFAVSAPQIAGLTAFCEGSNSELQAEAGFASYLWSTTENASQITVTQEGTYTVSVTDANGCESQSSITIIENPNPDVQIGGFNSFCPGGFTVLNAGATYASYQWSDNTNGETLQVNVPGTYGLTVTDNEGCVGSGSLNVIENDELSPVISGELTYCPGGSTLLNAGTGYATYQWSDNSSNPTLLVNAPGDYSVTVSDQSGCVGDVTVTIAEFDPPQPFIIGIDEFCAGESTDLSVGGGNFMAFDWSTGLTTTSITVSSGGFYSVLVTDENNCQETASITLTENPLPVFSILGDTEFCQGDQTTLMASDVFQEYEWSTGDMGQQTTTNLTGQITLTVSNEFGCTSESSVVLEAIPLPVADAGQDGLINCYSETTVLGGTGSSQGSQFTYTWSGPGIDTSNMNEQFPEVGVGGTYFLTILNTDYNCLSQEVEVFIADNTDEPVVVLEVLDILDCTTSTVVIDGTGSETGTGVVYEWFDGNMNPIASTDNPILEASAADTYTLLVSDTLSGCSALESISVQEDIAYPFAEAGTPQHLDCDVLEVTLNSQGSTTSPDIIFVWTDAEGTFISADSAVQVTEPGWYFLQVADEVNNCSNMDSVLVTQDVAVPLANAGQDQELNCQITAIALSGAGSTVGPTISYSWAYGNLDNIVGQGLSYQAAEAGTYYLIVHDADNDCSNTDAVLVSADETQPTDLLMAIDPPTCFGDTDGSIILQNVVGGTPPYQYSFEGQAFSDNSAFFNLGAGNYTIEVLDAMGCDFELEAYIEDGNDLYLELGDDIPINLGESATIIAQVNIGEDEISSLNWKFIDSLDCEICLSVTVSPLQSTQYFVDLVDENGCTISDDITVFVDKRKAIFVPNIFSPNGDGANDVFMIQSGPDVVKINSFQVFNRWGESVFEVYNFPPNEAIYGWDGTHREQLSNSAVFVWFAEVAFEDGEVVLFKGDVTLMR